VRRIAGALGNAARPERESYTDVTKLTLKVWAASPDAVRATRRRRHRRPGADPRGVRVRLGAARAGHHPALRCGPGA